MRSARAASMILAAVVITSCIAFAHLPVAAQSSATPVEVVVQHDVPMKTRDGVALFADIYRLKSDEKFPVILMRTPYDKNVGWAVSPAYQIARRGYVVVIQDVVAAIPPKASGIRSGMNKPTATIQWSGSPRSRTRTAKSG